MVIIIPGASVIVVRRERGKGGSQKVHTHYMDLPLRRWWAPPHVRSVPLKGIHRLFSEAEQVRLIVARVGGPLSALLSLSHSREPVSRRRMIDGTAHPLVVGEGNGYFNSWDPARRTSRD